MSCDFDVREERRYGDSMKWSSPEMIRRAGSEDVLPLWVADMDFRVAEPIVQALRQRVENGVYGYTFLDGDFSAAICGWYSRRHNWTIEPETISFATGVLNGMSALLSLITQPGQGVIIQPPIYYPFANTIRALGRQVVNSPLVQDGQGRYEMDFADLADKVKTHKVIIISSPHNPTGRVWSRDELWRLGRLCLDNGVFLLVDEIHCDLTRAGLVHTPLATLFPEELDRCAFFLSTSKTFNLAGLGCAHVIIPDPELRERYEDSIHRGLAIHGPSPFAIAAVKAAYSHCDQWVDEAKLYIDGNMSALRDYLGQELPGCLCPIPEGTYLAWPQVSAYTKDTLALEERLLKEERLYLEAGEIFGPGGAGHLRINCACPRPLLLEAAARLSRLLKS